MKNHTQLHIKTDGFKNALKSGYLQKQISNGSAWTHNTKTEIFENSAEKWSIMNGRKWRFLTRLEKMIFIIFSPFQSIISMKCVVENTGKIIFNIKKLALLLCCFTVAMAVMVVRMRHNCASQLHGTVKLLVFETHFGSSQIKGACSRLFDKVGWCRAGCKYIFKIRTAPVNTRSVPRGEARLAIQD